MIYRFHPELLYENDKSIELLSWQKLIEGTAKNNPVLVRLNIISTYFINGCYSCLLFWIFILISKPIIMCIYITIDVN